MHPAHLTCLRKVDTGLRTSLPHALEIFLQALQVLSTSGSACGTSAPPQTSTLAIRVVANLPRPGLVDDFDQSWLSRTLLEKPPAKPASTSCSSALWTNKVWGQGQSTVLSAGCLNSGLVPPNQLYRTVYPSGRVANPCFGCNLESV